MIEAKLKPPVDNRDGDLPAPEALSPIGWLAMGRDQRVRHCRIAQEDQFFTFEIDHIIAEQHGGLTIETNLCLACTDCNGFKGSNIASVDWQGDQTIVGLFNPRRHVWHEHFRLDLTDGRILPLTACGRVTAVLLRFNTTERLTDRQLLLTVNRYPCKGLSQ